jgi:hypothetical protein
MSEVCDEAQTHVTPEKSNPVTPRRIGGAVADVAAANINDAMRDQLEFLIEHAHTNGLRMRSLAIATSAPFGASRIFSA